MLFSVTGFAWEVSQYPTLIGCGAAAVHVYMYYMCSIQILKGGGDPPPWPYVEKTLTWVYSSKYSTIFLCLVLCIRHTSLLHSLNLHIIQCAVYLHGGGGAR